MDVTPLTVDVWSDVACPWCYIGKRRLEQALARFPHADQVQVRFHSFQLDPSLPARHEGSERDYLVQHKGMAAATVDQMMARVAGLAADEGLRFDFDRAVVANTLPAHQLLHLAAAHDVAAPVKEALLAAHFVEGRDIGDPAVLAGIGEQAGIPATEVTAALDDGRYREAVAADVAEAGRLGIQGVPFYVLDGRYGLSGAQPADTFLQALETVWGQAHEG